MRELIARNKVFVSAMLFSAMTGTALASESTEAPPSIWDGDIATSIFAILMFGMLVFVLGKYAWGPILPGLKNREDYIRQQIKDAERMKSEADKSLRRYESRMEKAQERADEIIDQSREQAEQIARKITEQARQEAADIVSQTASAIKIAREQAIRDIHGYTVELAVELAGKILAKEIAPQDHSALIQQAVEEINGK